LQRARHAPRLALDRGARRLHRRRACLARGARTVSVAELRGLRQRCLRDRFVRLRSEGGDAGRRRRVYDEQDTRKLVGNLKGKLLLACGDLDDTVPDYQSRQLIDALIKANKDFDLLVVPNQNHGITGNPYFIRRRWDYFVRHLLGAEPPDEYRLKPM
jgi:pimeloyl-ACP methyl ester carboxylesterase